MPYPPTAHRDNPAPRLDDIIRRRLGARLRAGYAEFERQPLPDEHVDLLLRLRRVERERQPKRA